jgi:hypothetical protein
MLIEAMLAGSIFLSLAWIAAKGLVAMADAGRRPQAVPVPVRRRQVRTRRERR